MCQKTGQTWELFADGSTIKPHSEREKKMNVEVEVADQVRKVAQVLDYLSNNTKDEGLAFILEQCVNDLTMAIHGVPDNEHRTDDIPFD